MPSPLSTEELSFLVGCIYDCALDPQRWPTAMEAICQALDLRTGVVSLISLPDGEPLLAAATGFEAPWLDKVFFYAQELVDLWGGEALIQRLPLDQPAVLSQVNPAAIAASTSHPFHLQFNRPQGFIDAVAIGLTRDAGSIGSIGFNRHEDAGLIGPREVEGLRLLLPHLQRSATISRVLEARSVAARSFEAVIAGLAAPILLVERSLRLLYANPAAERLLAEGQELALREGRLRLAAEGAQKALERSLAPPGEGGGPQSVLHPFGIPLAGEGSRLRGLHLLPLPPGYASAGPAGDSFALVFAARPIAAENVSLTVASLFGLTEAERRVFAQIASGLTVQESAGGLGIAVSTLRTHLLRIFDKTGTHRQAELVGLAASFSSPLV